MLKNTPCSAIDHIRARFFRNSVRARPARKKRCHGKIRLVIPSVMFRCNVHAPRTIREGARAVQRGCIRKFGSRCRQVGERIGDKKEKIDALVFREQTCAVVALQLEPFEKAHIWIRRPAKRLVEHSGCLYSDVAASNHKSTYAPQDGLQKSIESLVWHVTSTITPGNARERTFQRTDR